MTAAERSVVLVTGCSPGIGRALAREFSRAGHRCFASARRPESVLELEREGLESVALDVTWGVVRAATARRAPRTLRAGNGVAVLRALGRLPGRARARLFRRIFDLGELAQRG